VLIAVRRLGQHTRVQILGVHCQTCVNLRPVVDLAASADDKRGAWPVADAARAHARQIYRCSSFTGFHNKFLIVLTPAESSNRRYLIIAKIRTATDANERKYGRRSDT
jgi:hypothetical protein